ncbi:hypothetical protein, conserved [Eimeria acervulina]|uniref:Uncharacterized protein n=1 Tax=Eimeria acervulina TaxID=5801 RepID=U6GW08_EIMAC|nr:hypothetical protein, conserved [Eimeria acervulina]CDI84441.1 hypothetical protein, conserved [Eimeria acervulina]
MGAVQRDGLNFAFIALQQEHEKALQQLSSEIGKARSSVNLMRVQSRTSLGVNSFAVLCNVGLLSYLKETWNGTVARLEGVQVRPKFLHF